MQPGWVRTALTDAPGTEPTTTAQLCTEDAGSKSAAWFQLLAISLSLLPFSFCGDLRRAGLKQPRQGAAFTPLLKNRLKSSACI